MGGIKALLHRQSRVSNSLAQARQLIKKKKIEEFRLVIIKDGNIASC